MLQKCELRQFYAYYGNIGCEAWDRERGYKTYFSYTFPTHFDAS